MQRIPAISVSVALGIGFGYACLGVLSIIGSRVLGMTTFGYRLWWLEVLIALLAGFGAFALFMAYFAFYSRHHLVAAAPEEEFEALAAASRDVR